MRDFDPVHDRLGSVALHRDVRDARGMSAMPPIAIESVPRNETSLRANRVLTHRSEKAPLFDHLVGAGEQRRPHLDAEHALAVLRLIAVS
jgi:hypothetical protein